MNRYKLLVELSKHIYSKEEQNIMLGLPTKVLERMLKRFEFAKTL